MRINHNIAALNTYRQLGATQANASKSMEKLSSGFRINNAADDAAGLAISEKMRGQIRGLNQASRNSQDGISLIQTAEGALIETQAILQRMRELAVQAGNDTNADLDRTEIQNELDQLTSEINRIGNTTEFNTQKLLSGGAEDIKHNATISGSTLKGGTEAIAANVEIVTLEVGAAEVSAKHTVDIGTFTGTTEEVLAKYTIDVGTFTSGQVFALDFDGDGTAEVSFTEGTSGVAEANTKEQNTAAIFSALLGDNDVTDNWIVTSNGSTLTFEAKSNTTYAGVVGNNLAVHSDTNNTGSSVVRDKDGVTGVDTPSGSVSFNFGGTLGTITYTAADFTPVTGDKVANTKAIFDLLSNNTGITSNYTITNNGDTLTFEAKSTGTYAGAAGNDFDVTHTGGSMSTLETGVTGANAKGTITFDEVPTEDSTITIGGKVIGFYDSSLGNYASNAVARFAMGVDYAVDIDGKNANQLAGAVTSAVGNLSGFSLSATDNVITVTANDFGEAGDDFLAKIDNADAQKATGTISFSGVPTEGATFKIGEITIAFWDSSDAGMYEDAEEAAKALGVKEDALIDLETAGVGNTRITTAAQAAAAFAALSSDYEAAGTVVTISAASAGKAGNETAFGIGGDKGAGYNISLQIGANTAQSFGVNIEDMRAAALGVSGVVKEGTIIASDGKTKATFTSNLSVSDGTTSETKEYSLDLSTHEKATAAISVIDDAINTVSSERSKLGAMQNRLEHTISNLGTSAENLTAAESRIRDVDMAAEMMEFTKNNILTQAAQAMLAQANQAPQGILQLLR
ncbi:MAG: flagellin [Peptococcales bacterium]|jgi:flagellin